MSKRGALIELVYDWCCMDDAGALLAGSESACVGPASADARERALHLQHPSSFDSLNSRLSGSVIFWVWSFLVTSHPIPPAHLGTNTSPSTTPVTLTFTHLPTHSPWKTGTGRTEYWIYSSTFPRFVFPSLLFLASNRLGPLPTGLAFHLRTQLVWPFIYFFSRALSTFDTFYSHSHFSFSYTFSLSSSRHFTVL